VNAAVTRRWSIAKGDQREAERARHEFCADLTGSVAELFDAELIFGELVANAVKCARTSVSVELVIHRNATLRVIDDGDCFDLKAIGPKPYYAIGGRGLYIVRSLARRLTVNLSDDKCEVTAVLRL
jgi:anti-sigma regulatory factor (Ser/Thr protein kinase)